MGKLLPNACVVCCRRRCTDLLCDKCSYSYDVATAHDATANGLIRWAAQRARDYALKRTPVSERRGPSLANPRRGARIDRPIPFVPTDLRGTTVEPAPTDPNRPRAKR